MSWTAASFLAADQRQFGEAWRYELVDGLAVALEAASPRHGQINANIACLVDALRGTGARLEIGSAIGSPNLQGTTVRIPDALIRYDGQPLVVFEVVSPSELLAWRARDRRRRDMQNVRSVQEIVEFSQDEPSVLVYRRGLNGTWIFESADDLEGAITLMSVGLVIQLAEIYEGVGFDKSAVDHMCDASVEISATTLSRSESVMPLTEPDAQPASDPVTIPTVRKQSEAKAIAREFYPFQCCVICGLQMPTALDVAHLDQNAGNNNPDNLAWLCKTHHWMVDCDLYPLEAVKLMRKRWQETEGKPSHAGRMKQAGSKAADTRKRAAIARKRSASALKAWTTRRAKPDKDD